MQDGWIPEIFTTCEAGVSSAFEPELIPQNQLAWMINGRTRGGKAATRPFLVQRLILPEGNIQGVSYFSIQNGMIILQVGGRLYRVRISNRTYSYDEIQLPFVGSAKLPYAWMVETVGSIVVQDGQSYPIIYDGSTARRADPTKNEVPLGTAMAFGNGRLWVAVRSNELVAGDIKTRVFQSELKFTESQYFSGGGAFYFPFAINALAFVPASGAAGYGSLMVFGKNQTHGVRADIAQRDLWPDYPGFIQPILLNTGAASQFSMTEANQDLFWRDGDGGVRSLRTAVVAEAGGPGNTPLSREIARIVDFESEHRLGACSAVLFDNRYLMTASPFINIHNQTSFRDIVSLDFAPLASNRGKAPPAYDGEWDGLNFVRLVKGSFRGEERAFALTTDDDGNNRLWEIVEEGTRDRYETCSGEDLIQQESPVPMTIEFPSRDFGDPSTRKRLERCDVYLQNMEGEMTMEVYWRADNFQEWSRWDGINADAQMTDPSTVAPHVFLNIKSQERVQIMTYTIPEEMNLITQRAKHVGFMFQIRIVLTGKARVDKTIVYATMLPKEQFAERTEYLASS